MIYILDVDGCVTESKSPITSSMAEALVALAKEHRVVFITGGRLEQLLRQVVSCFPEELRSNVLLCPTMASLYAWINGLWTSLRADTLRDSEVTLICSKLAQISAHLFGRSNSIEIFGPQIEVRGAQVTFSAIGQAAPVEKKKVWNKQHEKTRSEMARRLSAELPNYTVRIGGLTSVDITRKGVDKALGVTRVLEYLSASKEDAVFIGDALCPGGNDEPVKSTGVLCISTTGPEQTEKTIRSWQNSQNAPTPT